MITRFRLPSSLAIRQSYRRQLAVLASLLFATALCLALLAVRAWHFHSSAQSWLVWNLFLAWLPAVGAFAAYNLNDRPARLRWLPVIGFSVLWLLFLPNAPYLITDIIHLKPRHGVPLWYDLITLVTFAWTGSFLGLVSLSLMQELVRRTAGRAASWLFVLGVLVLNGFGIYFGRFLGWNSWDVLLRPTGLLFEVLDGLVHPLEHLQTLAFAGLFTLLFSAVYLMLVSFTHLQLEHRQH
ncbi:MAG TPA: DUF1361 domain-containing protein [Blastocatellia bacterium]|nr:DUF1361 domain-containing protein [Blastocatellia bacterium]